jgi:branched-chain amino acid transport system substrate-binding protein
MHANDLFGQNQARGFLAAHKAARPGWDIVVLREDSEYVIASAPWPNFKNPRARLVAGEYEKRSGKIFDTNSGYSYDGILLVADILERAGQAGVKPTAWHPDEVVVAMKKTSFSLMVYAGPVVFNEMGDNPNAIPVMVQVLHQKPVVVWPKDAAAERFVFPRPRR